MSWFSFKKKVQIKRDYSITFFPIFSELTPSEIELVESKVRLVELKKGEAVYRKGESETAFYLILTGRLRILRENGQIINHLHPGDYFGETSVLTNRPHSATVEALNDSVLLKIEKDDFLSLVKQIPSLSLHISRTLGHRLTRHVDERVLSGDAKIVSFCHKRSRVGNTTFAANLASALIRETKKKVIFLDLSDLAGAQEKHLVFKNVEAFQLSEFGLANSHKLESFIVKNKASFDILKVLAAESQSDVEKKLSHLLIHLLSRYQFVLVDLPIEINPLIFKAIHQSDVVYFLIDESERDSEEIRMAIQEFKSSYGFTEDQIRLILKEDDGQEKNEHLYSPEPVVPVFSTLPRLPEIENRVAEEKKQFFELEPNHRYARTVRFLAREISGQALGLALGSGAAFGYAHVGVLKVLEEEGIEVDILSASSIGAVIGGMWAAGIPANRLIGILKTLDRRNTFFKLFGFADLSVAHRGFFKGEQVVRFLRSYVGDINFRDLKIPIKIISTDLSTGSPVLFDEGSVLQAIRASISIPGIFRPIYVKGKYLIDGGVVDPLPIQVLNRFGAKKIIAVNVLQSPEDHFHRLQIIQKKKERASEIIEHKNFFKRLFYENQKSFLNKQSANIFNVLMKTIQFMEYGMAEAASEQADITLRPVVTDAHWAEFFDHEKFIRCGEEETRKHIAAIRKLVKE